jgi:hypothetical protein
VISRNFPAIHHIEAFAFHESVVRVEDLARNTVSLTTRGSTSISSAAFQGDEHVLQWLVQCSLN